MVLVFLVILTSGLQYVVQKMNYARDLEKVRQTIRNARLAAWGPKMVPLEGRRKVKVNLGGAPRMNEEGNMVPGKMIDTVVDGNEVYICDGPDLHLLDESSATTPAISRTWFVSLVWQLVGKKEPIEEVVEESEEGSESGGNPSMTTRKTGRPAPANKAGGRRRRAVRQR